MLRDRGAPRLYDAARGLKNKKRCTRVCVEWQLRAVEGDVDMVMVNDAILSAATELGIIDEVQAYLENGVGYM